MDRGAWWVIVHGVTKSQTRLSDQHTLSLVSRHGLQAALNGVTRLLVDFVTNWSPKFCGFPSDFYEHLAPCHTSKSTYVE